MFENNSTTEKLSTNNQKIFRKPGRSIDRPMERKKGFNKAKGLKKIFDTDLSGEETILMVEDDNFVRCVNSRILSRFGYQVIEASCAEEAIEKYNLHRDEIKLLMTDIMMPGANGYELAELLTEKSPSLKVLFNSGYAHGVIDEEIIKQEHVAFIQKPFTPNNLAQKIRNIIEI